jgi:hypothetical protein
MDLNDLVSTAEVNEVLAKLETLAKALGLKIIHCPEKYPPLPLGGYNHQHNYNPCDKCHNTGFITAKDDV